MVVREVLLQRYSIQLARYARLREERLDFRRKPQAALVASIDERFYSHPITREEKPPSPCVPDTKGEHTPQSGHTIRPPGNVCGKNHLGIRGRAKPVSQSAELRPQLLEVVDLTVVGDPRRAVLGGHRLGPALEIDDGEPAVSEPDRSFDMKPFTVRAAVNQTVRHPPDGCPLDGRPASIQNTGNATHDQLLVRLTGCAPT